MSPPSEERDFRTPATKFYTPDDETEYPSSRAPSVTYSRKTYPASNVHESSRPAEGAPRAAPPPQANP
ncbi:hypothetical protein FRC06_009888, partial [Ceratobasidium sp. 370]